MRLIRHIKRNGFWYFTYGGSSVGGILSTVLWPTPIEDWPRWVAIGALSGLVSGVVCAVIYLAVVLVVGAIQDRQEGEHNV